MSRLLPGRSNKTGAEGPSVVCLLLPELSCLYMQIATTDRRLELERLLKAIYKMLRTTQSCIIVMRSLAPAQTQARHNLWQCCMSRMLKVHGQLKTSDCWDSLLHMLGISCSKAAKACFHGEKSSSNCSFSSWQASKPESDLFGRVQIALVFGDCVGQPVHFQGQTDISLID